MVQRNKFEGLDEDYNQLGIACGCDPSYGLTCHFVFAKNLKKSKDIPTVEPMQLTYQKECVCGKWLYTR